MKIQEAINEIDRILQEESLSKFGRALDDEALARLGLAQKNLEDIKNSSVKKENLPVDDELENLFRSRITSETAISIDEAVNQWRKCIFNTKRELKRKPKVVGSFIATAIGLFILIGCIIYHACSSNGNPILTKVVDLILYASSSEAFVSLATALIVLLSGRSHSKNGENASCSPDEKSVRGNNTKQVVKIKIDNSVHINSGIIILTVVLIFVLLLAALIGVSVGVFALKGGFESNSTTTGSQPQDSPVEKPVIEYDGFDVFINEDGETVTVSINTQKEGTEIEFPSKILHEGKAYRVTAVGRAALTKNDKIQSVNLSTSIERIESGAFAYFSALKDIFLPGSLTYIGENAFLGCANLKKVNADDLKSWCRITFEGENSNPLSLNDDSVLTIADKAITGEPIIEGIDIIPAYTFRNTDISRVTFESGVTAIGTKAFFNCTQLATVWDKCALNIEKGSTGNGYVGYYAEHIYSVDSETGRIATEDGYLFDESGTPSLVGYSGNAETLNLPAAAPHGTPYEIAEDVFRNHASITSVTIPDGVTKIGDNAFYGCTSLEQVDVSDIPTWCKIDFGGLYANPLYYAKHLYLTNGEVTDLSVSDGITEIKPYAFCGGAFASVTIGDGVTSIGDNAFYNCLIQEATISAGAISSISQSKLTKVTVTSGAIGARAFYNCTSLTSATIEDGVTSIGESAFYGCDALRSITLPFVGNGAGIAYFSYLFGSSSYSYSRYVPNSLQEVIITGGVSIGEGAFYRCDKLTSITIPGSVTSFGGEAFYGCSALTSMTIPDSVTSIGESAFYGCSSLTTVAIGKNLTEIGDKAFYNCSMLARVDVSDISAWCKIDFGGLYANPLYYAKRLYLTNDEVTKLSVSDGITEIKPYAFCGGAFTSVTIGNDLTKIGDNAFYDCTSLARVDVSDIPTWCKIDFGGLYANPLYYAKRLYLKNDEVTKLSVSDGITEIKPYAFCGGAFASVTIGDGVTSIGISAFYDCTAVTRVTIGDGVTSIGDNAFENCPIEEATISAGAISSIPRDGLQKVVLTSGAIAAQAFYHCGSLTNVTIEGSVTSVGDGAFGNCSSLESVTFDENGVLTSIGSSAFADCSLLTRIEIPKNVSSIGNNAFDKCSSLTDITIPKDLNSIGSSAFDGCPIQEAIMPAIAISSIPKSQLTEVTVTSGAIGARAFYNYTSLTSAKIEDGVTSIGESAFYGCDSIRSITLPFVGNGAGITYFSYLFGSSSYLYTWYVPDSLQEVIITGGTSIGEGAFYGCDKLTSITIPGSVTSLGDEAFYGCGALTSITIPDSVNSIGDSAFCYCRGLTSITIPDGMTSIGQDAFNGCRGLTSIIIPGSLKSLGAEAFCGCDSLESVTFEDNCQLTSLDHTFYGCNSLESVTFGDNCQLTSIGDHSFYGCNSLESVTFGENSRLTSIGESAFWGCRRLFGFELPEGVTSIGESAFGSCSLLTSITIPASVKSIGERAFLGCFNLLEVWNYSRLPIAKGEDSYGDVARFAENVYETSEKSKQTVTEEGYIFYEEGEKIYLIGYKGKQTALTLPALSPSGKSYEINDFAFYNCTALKNIKIPDSITSIDGFAFHGCSLLESVTFGEKSQLVSIEIMAFEYCSSLTSIHLPDSVKSISGSAFHGCSSLKNIVIPESATSIGLDAFEGCTNLTIYCEASEKPSGWNENWNPDDRPVIWGYKGKK